LLLCNFAAYNLDKLTLYYLSYFSPARVTTAGGVKPGCSSHFNDIPMSGNNVYSIISLTTPAPTVRPPSRIAKRRPASIAIGVINSPKIWMLSPGITISTPSSRVQTPVTSVVRK